MLFQDALLQMVLRKAPQYLFWKDRQNRYVGCNENFARLSGVVDVQDIAGKTDLALAWPREQAEAFMIMDDGVMSSGAPLLEHEEMCVANAEKRMCILTSRIPLFDKDMAVGMVGMFVDITEISQRELALVEELSDLKSFKDISFDREIRMVELKKEVNALAKALGRPPVYDLSFLQGK